ncbi:hypothetical protein BaRGS_00034017 [Batillaria attramentaria]|uniref:Uncharacterized protein n=1 Tax=Batillaria attramentaria TaxID=370345 RepID=A0ABD0JIG4_9CAEN
MRRCFTLCNPAVSRRPPPAHTLFGSTERFYSTVCLLGGQSATAVYNELNLWKNPCLQELRNGPQHLLSGLPSVHSLPSSRASSCRGNLFIKLQPHKDQISLVTPHHRYRVPPQAFPISKRAQFIS